MPADHVPVWLAGYLAERDRERAERRDEAFGKLTIREQRLCREFAVMGFVQGVMHAGGTPETAPVPKDGESLRRTLDGLLAMPDLYPVFAAVTAA